MNSWHGGRSGCMGEGGYYKFHFKASAILNNIRSLSIISCSRIPSVKQAPNNRIYRLLRDILLPVAQTWRAGWNSVSTLPAEGKCHRGRLTPRGRGHIALRTLSWYTYQTFLTDSCESSVASLYWILQRYTQTSRQRAHFYTHHSIWKLQDCNHQI